MTMNYDTYGLPSGGFEYGTGAGWLPGVAQRDQLLASLYGMQGGLGQNLLNTLTNLITSPTSGPLGLAATAKFGNPQGIAAGTGGAGFDNSQYTSVFDALLKGLSQSVMNPGSPFNPANKGQYNTGAAKIDPNKAPAPTPEAAAQAPNAWQSAFDAFHPAGQTAGENAAIGAVPNDVWQSLLPRMMAGGMLTAHSHAPSYADGGLVGLNEAASVAERYGVSRDQFAKQLQYINELGTNVRNAANNQDTRGLNLGKTLLDARQLAYPSGTMQAPTDPNNPSIVNYLGTGADINDVQSWDPNIIRAMLQMSGLMPKSLGMADGGGVTLGGEPHFITDAKGNTVARITEDGAPEHIGGIGGVEVTPMDPLRNALYKVRKAATPGGRPGPVTGANPVSTAYGKMLAQMEGEMKAAEPGFATGGDMLFPYYPGGKVNTGTTRPGDTTREIPTFGGGTERGNIGTPFSPSGGNTLGDLMKGINDISGSNYNERYAKLLGGGLSRDMAIAPEHLSAFNAGKSPNQLLSAQELSTMSPSQRQAYTALLQQQGIIGQPADLDYWVKAFTPTALS